MSATAPVALQSSPPLRALAPLLLALMLVSAHFFAPLFSDAQSLATWRLTGGSATLAALVCLLVWLARADSFRITGESLEVYRIIGPRPRYLPLRELTSVGAVKRGFVGLTVIELRFRSGATVCIPRYYTNFASFARMVFSQLGANVEAQRTVA